MSISKHDLDRFAKLIEMIIDNNPITPNPKKLSGRWLFNQWKYTDDAFSNGFAGEVYGGKFSFSDISCNNCPICKEQEQKQNFKDHYCEDTIQPEINKCYEIFKQYKSILENDFINKKAKSRKS